MNTPHPGPAPEPLSAEERDLALRLARLDASAGPSPALDARILAAARGAAQAPTRRARRWPGAVGAAAVLVAAVGLAWQLRPMFELPPPAVPQAEGTGSETVVQIENVRRKTEAAADVASGPVAATGHAASAAPRPRAPAPVAVPQARRVVRDAPRPPHAPEFMDEAVPVAAPAASAAAAAPPPAAAPQAAMRTAPAAQAKAAPAAGADALPADIDADTRLPARDWLARVRARRDAGDIEGAHASLLRFVARYPRRRVPADLRPLLRDDPWSP